MLKNRARQPTPVCRGAGGAARPHGRFGGRYHGRPARDRDACRRACRLNLTADEVAKLRRLLAEAETEINDLDRFTRLSRDFHLAVAEASHNRVLVIQLISLEHVSWPRRNVTATPKLARHIFDIHTKLADLIELRDAAATRALMDDHVKMIRARRVAERGQAPEGAGLL